MKKLQIGCGVMSKSSNRGWVNLDLHEAPGVDVVHDLNDIPLPFKDKEFDFILAREILEHLTVDFDELMKEFYRIMKPKSRIFLTVPYCTSDGNFDVFHRRSFNYHSFDRLGTRNSTSLEALNCPKFGVQIKIVFEQSFPYSLWNFFFEKVVNLHRLTKIFYEKTGWKYIFPAKSYHVMLIKE